MSLIPEPVKMIFNSGHFIIKDDTLILADSKLKMISDYLKRLIAPPTGFDNQIKINNSNELPNNAIILQINTELDYLGDEGYHLVTTPKNVQISALYPAGIFYGVQSFRQLLPAEVEKRSYVSSVDWVVPCVKIEDYPRFSWRGFMLDESRHFLGKKIVKRMLDLMALHKMNVFHWHLTDDQGWRIEIKKYPRLIEVGSKRNGTQVEGMWNFLTKKVNYTPHCGYYTQEDIKDIVSYAKERFINVIPEIDMPGHTMAALAAYPEFSCAGEVFKVPTTFGINTDVICPGKEKGYVFLCNVLDEILELFPSKIIHIGGDEVPKTRWKECPDCQVKIKTEGLNSEKELQTYFINRIASYLIEQGKIPIVWNDTLDDNLVTEALGQHWLHGDEKVLEHLRRGRKFVISRFFYAYLDYPYTRIPLRKAYSFEPLPEELEEKYHLNVLGLEAPMWTEWVSTTKRLDWQTFPRLTAHAETGWTLQINKNYSSFKNRLERFLKRLDLLGVKYAGLNKTDPTIFRRVFSSTWISVVIGRLLFKLKVKSNQENITD